MAQQRWLRPAVLLLVACLAAQAYAADFVVKSAKRQVDASAYRTSIKTTLRLTAESKGLIRVTLCEPQRLVDAQALLEVILEDSGKQTALRQAAPTSPAGKPADVACWEYTLPEPSKKGSELELTVAGVYVGLLEAHPAEVKQGEPQRVAYTDVAYVQTPYTVQTQETSVRTGSGSVEDFSGPEPNDRSGSEIEYGPYSNVKPFTAGKLTVHFESRAEFLEATTLEREIEVSHWGNVYFEERYNVRNAGPKVVGKWSRLDVLQRPSASAGAIKQLTATLPAPAHSLYFRDEIGNISSSAARFTSSAVRVVLNPRYPLFGGWAAAFKFGWSQPLETAVAKAGSGRSVLAITLGPSIKDVVAREMLVKVVLPEGASDIKVMCTVEAEMSEERRYTYLDVFGRRVVVLRLHNFVPEMNVPLEVEYSYSTRALLQKPLLLTSGFGALFLLALVSGLRSANGQQVANSKEKTS